MFYSVLEIGSEFSDLDSVVFVVICIDRQHHAAKTVKFLRRCKNSKHKQKSFIKHARYFRILHFGLEQANRKGKGYSFTPYCLARVMFGIRVLSYL